MKNLLPVLNPFVLGLRESATLAINLKALEMRAEGKDVTHLGFGQSPFPVPKPVRDALGRNTDKKEYLPTLGLPELRKAIAGYYQKEFGYLYNESDVCVGPGSKELLFQLIYLMEGTLLFPGPSWVSYGPQAHLHGKDFIAIETSRENKYKLTAEDLRKSCSGLGEEQKLLVLNNPNNPTGAVYSDAEIESLSVVCREFGIIVISDEIYAAIDFTDKKQASMHKYYPEGTIVTGGLSKLFAAGGYRLGLMLIPETLHVLRDALKVVISETFSAVSSPIQYSAVEAYGNFDSIRKFMETTTEIHRYAGEYLHERFVEMGLNCPKPEGSFYLFPDFENYREKFESYGIYTGEDMVKVILSEAGVAVLPGSDFYLPKESLGVRVASVDYDGDYVLKRWPGYEKMKAEHKKEFFPSLIAGCNRLEKFLSVL